MATLLSLKRFLVAQVKDRKRMEAASKRIDLLRRRTTLPPDWNSVELIRKFRGPI